MKLYGIRKNCIKFERIVWNSFFVSFDGLLEILYKILTFRHYSQFLNQMIIIFFSYPKFERSLFYRKLPQIERHPIDIKGWVFG